MFSERVEKYKNIKCYTKEGLDKDSYIVSVTMDMKFEDQDNDPVFGDFLCKNG